MATRKENIATALDNIAAAIASLTSNPRPNYSIDGRSYSWQSLLDSLLKNQEQLLIADQQADGPFEVFSLPPDSF